MEDFEIHTWRCPYHCGWYRRYSEYQQCRADIRNHNCETHTAAIRRLTQTALINGWLNYDGNNRTQPSWLVKSTRTSTSRKTVSGHAPVEQRDDAVDSGTDSTSTATTETEN